MFHSLTTAAILLPMLFHSLFGCCWHHAHGIDRRMPSQTAEVDEACHTHAGHGCCSHWKTQKSDCSHGETSLPCCPDDQRQPCSEELCVYGLSETIRPEIPEVSLLDEVAFVESQAIVATLSGSAYVEMRVMGTSVCLPSPRALTQVWIV
jgi:hypothetical protein